MRLFGSEAAPTPDPADAARAAMQVDQELEAVSQNPTPGFWQGMWRRVRGTGSSGEGDATDAYGLTDEQRVRFRQAVPLYEAHINTALASKQWGEGRRRLEQLAKLRILLGERGAGAGHLVSAGDCCIRMASDIEAGKAVATPPGDTPSTPAQTVPELLSDSVALRERAISEALAGGHYHQAAGCMEALSEFIRGQRGSPHAESLPTQQRAMDLLVDAAKLYHTHRRQQHAVECLKSVAAVLQGEGCYGDAAQLWLQCCEFATEVPLLRLSAVKHVVSAGLCKLAEAAQQHQQQKQRQQQEPEEEAAEEGGCPFDAVLSYMELLCDVDPQFTPRRAEYIALERLVDEARDVVQQRKPPSAFPGPADPALASLRLELHQQKLLRELKALLSGRSAANDGGKKQNSVVGKLLAWMK